jgi:hypothetical protein
VPALEVIQAVRARGKVPAKHYDSHHLFNFSCGFGLQKSPDDTRIAQRSDRLGNFGFSVKPQE